MSGIRGKNTRPELLVRKFLHAQGYRYRLHRKELPGTPDIVLPKLRICIFVHGCFWHQHEACKYATIPKTRPEFWEAKFRESKDRDKKANDALGRLGWSVLTVWECELKGRAQGLPRLLAALERASRD
ncbi:very short patch repair endonuclease [Halopseudomonas pachastrellae]|nr:very short patch repair endonuclease [Halopseudomonas pachastrellae]WVM94411.1 very short patch repair endonuclease [Halopseudomonas pachastrellae]